MGQEGSKRTYRALANWTGKYSGFQTFGICLIGWSFFPQISVHTLTDSTYNEVCMTPKNGFSFSLPSLFQFFTNFLKSSSAINAHTPHVNGPISLLCSV